MKFLVVLRRDDRARFIEELGLFLIERLKLTRTKYDIGVVTLRERVPRNAAVTTHDDKAIVVSISEGLSPQSLASSLCHEFVHVWQIARGTLKQVSATTVRWRGRAYVVDRLPYTKRPWELQALREQDVLVREFEDRRAER